MLLRSVVIENFRAFERLELTGLGRVNLIVGQNNAGKTSVLEAIQFVAEGDARVLVASLARRGERALGRRSDARELMRLDARMLFHGRVLDGPALSVEVVDDDGSRRRQVVSTRPAEGLEVAHWKALQSSRPVSPVDGLDVGVLAGQPRFLEVVSSSGGRALVALHLDGSIDQELSLLGAGENSPLPASFIGPSGLSPAQASYLYDRAVISNEDGLLVEALNCVEDTISKVAAIEGGTAFVVGLRGVAGTVPLGSLGEGMSRMLAIALAMVAARGGVLLVDEIDAGLHHSVLRKLWTLILATAQRLDVAVFATTHSYDCVHALSAITRDRSPCDVALVRVERGNARGITFTEREIRLLAEREIEPR